jgi:hypothetical protein
VEILDELQPGATRHGEVGDDEVRAGLREALDRLGGASGLGAYLEIGLLSDELGDAGAHQRVIVDDHDPLPGSGDLVGNGLNGRVIHGGGTTKFTTVKPRPGPGTAGRRSICEPLGTRPT